STLHQSIPGKQTSLAYIASPETFSGPSRRGVGVPIILSSALFLRRGRTVGFWRVRCIEEKLAQRCIEGSLQTNSMEVDRRHAAVFEGIATPRLRHTVFDERTQHQAPEASVSHDAVMLFKVGFFMR